MLKGFVSPKEHGATALLVAMSMLLFMGIAAVVVDGGIGFSERRQAQAGVDFGALAALQFATSCSSGTCDIDDAVENGAEEAVDVVNANLPWATLNWGACEDLSRPGEFTRVSDFTECVSFTDTLSKSRVVLPDDEVPTTFGRLLGVNFLTIKAFAHAEWTLNAISRILPLTPAGANGAELCLFSNQAPQTVEPCAGSASGFFGYLDLALFGEVDAGTPATCNQGSTNTRIAINITRGADHSMVIFKSEDPIIDDFDACANGLENVNQVRVETGSPTGGITDGLINGISGSIQGQMFDSADGRVECLGGSCKFVRGVELDHTGLWEFLKAGICSPEPKTHAAMLDCLNTQSEPEMLIDELGDHPRFAAVPILVARPPAIAAPTGPGK